MLRKSWALIVGLVLLASCGTTVDIPSFAPVPNVSGSPFPVPSPSLSGNNLVCSIDGIVIFKGPAAGPFSIDVNGCFHFTNPLDDQPAQICADCSIGM
jgi:hypothetical protein